MRILNRSAQRYLVRRTTPPPVIGIPGADLVGSTDWHLEEARPAEKYRILAPDTAPLGEKAALDVDTWRFDPVGDGTSYCYIVDADAPKRALLASDDAPRTGDLDVSLGSIHRHDRRAMWLIQDACVADARSVHLRYETPSDLSLFYTEVFPGEAPPGTYFCAFGFGVDARGRYPGGYTGIQELIDGRRIAIFSIWHRLVDDEAPVADALATAVAVNAGAYETPFSGEGSGTSIRLPIDWRVAGDQPVRFAVTAEALGDDTVMSAYLAIGHEPWSSLGAIVRAGTGGRLMSNPYSFIEDFARTGNTDGVAPPDRSPYQMRSAHFSNAWYGAMPVSPEPAPVVRTEVSAYSPHPMEHLSAEQTEPYGVHLATGTPSAGRPPPIGAIFVDTNAQGRVPPRLDGVPYL